MAAAGASRKGLLGGGGGALGAVHPFARPLPSTPIIAPGPFPHLGAYAIATPAGKGPAYIRPYALHSPLTSSINRGWAPLPLPAE